MQIMIRNVSNGFIVEAGCITLVYTSPFDLVRDFERWVSNPSVVEKEFAEKLEVGPSQIKVPYHFEERSAGLRTR